MYMQLLSTIVQYQTTMYVWLNELDEAKGLDHGETYNNRFSGTLFLENISRVEKDNLQKLISDINFFSLTMDGSTDDSITEQESLFVRTSHKGKIITSFICIGEPESTCSSDLYQFVIAQMKDNGIYTDMGKLVGFGSDGASNMVGVKHGLVTLIKKDYPGVVGIHCLGHRLELAFKDALKKDKTYDKLVTCTLMLGMYYFYRNSPAQRKKLKKTFKIMDVRSQLPHRVGGSRWMPHMRKALNSLFTSYPAYITHLQTMSHSHAKAEGLVKLLGNRDILAYAALLKDLLEPLARLSLILQRQDITLGEIQLHVQATVDVLEQSITRKSDRLSSILETKKYMGYRLNEKKMGSLHPESCVKALVEAINIRFKDLSEDFQHTNIASLRNWPDEYSADFGEEHVESLKARFGDILVRQNLETSELLTEWRLLKSLVYRRFKGSVNTTKLTEVHSFCTSMGVDNILALFDLVNSLPPTSVLNECAFNQMKLLKTERRHRLSNAHLNDCMLIRLQSPSITNFNPSAAIDKWMITPSGQRRRGVSKNKTHISSVVNNYATVIDDDATVDATATNDNEVLNQDDIVTVNTPQEPNTDSQDPEKSKADLSEVEPENYVAGEEHIVELEAPVHGKSDDSDSDQANESDYESDFEFEQNERTNNYLLSKYSEEFE